jgi:predicted MFS family arabinose efflux permease
VNLQNQQAREPLAPAASPPAPTPQYRRYALFLLFLVFTSSHVDRQILAILLESIKRELVLSDTQLGFLSGIAFAIFYATLGIPMAMWADRSNRRNIITLALSLWSGMTVVCGLAGNFWQLALARIGVGVGEAGSTPPSHSIIADMYAPAERSTAMGIFSLGINCGLLIGFAVGGWINQWYGWRAAFWVVGAPGLALAVLVRYTLREPPRGYAEGVRAASSHEAPSLRAVVTYIWSTRALRHIISGTTLASFVGYGVVLWLPSFLARSHGLESSTIGMLLALGFGVFGAVGTFMGGALADRLGKRDIRWSVWVVSIAVLTALPFSVSFYLTKTTSTALLVAIVPAILGGTYLAPSFALNQGLVPMQMRSVASAFILFVANIIGLGLGPQTVGILSDVFRAQHGAESLRYALLTLACVNVWSAFHYFMASRTLRDDLLKAKNL